MRAVIGSLACRHPRPSPSTSQDGVFELICARVSVGGRVTTRAAQRTLQQVARKRRADYLRDDVSGCLLSFYTSIEYGPCSPPPLSSLCHSSLSCQNIVDLVRLPGLYVYPWSFHAFALRSSAFLVFCTRALSSIAVQWLAIITR